MNMKLLTKLMITLVLIFGIIAAFGITVNAATVEISNTDVEVITPYPGAKPSTVTRCEGGISVRNVVWYRYFSESNIQVMASTDTFETGYQYLVSVYISPLSGHTVNYKFSDSFSGSINGLRCTVQRPAQDPDSRILQYVFSCPRVISSADFTIGVPTIGSRFDFSPTTTSSDVTIQKTEWFGNTTGSGTVVYSTSSTVTYSIPPKTYTAKIYINVKNSDFTSFVPAGSFRATINGVTATVEEDENNPGTYCVQATFSPQKGKITGRFNISGLTTPAVHENLDTSLSLIVLKNVKFPAQDSITWLDSSNKKATGAAQPGQQYTLRVVIYPDDGYEFDYDNLDPRIYISESAGRFIMPEVKEGTPNGYPGGYVANAVTLTYTFPKLGSSMTEVDVTMVGTPTVGGEMRWFGTSTYDYSVGITTWSPSDTTYKSGVSYSATFNVNIDEFDGVFDNNVKVYVNVGGTRTQATVLSGAGTNQITVKYTMPALTESKTIKEADVTMVGTPTVGGEMRWFGTSTYDYSVGITTWSPSDTTYKSGVSYSATFNVNIDEFDGVFDNNVKVYVNVGGTRTQATVLSGAGTNQITVKYTMPALTANNVTRIVLSGLTLPVIGKNPDMELPIIVSEGAKVLSSFWYADGAILNKSSVFEAKEYSYHVVVEAADGYEFPDSSLMSATINGKSAEVYDITSATPRKEIVYLFKVSAAPVDSVSLRVENPAIGSAPASTATVESGNYSVTSVVWDTADIIFAENKTYTVIITLEADGENTFASSIVSALINNETATVISGAGTKTLKISYTFPAMTHTHKAGSEWISDSTQHWHVCTCGEKIELSAHTFSEWKTVKEATATEKGSKERVCSVCGYTDSAIVPATGSATGTSSTAGTTATGGTSTKDPGVDPSEKKGGFMWWIIPIAVGGVGAVAAAVVLTLKKRT